MIEILIAVSYTHLDVYKRQGIFFISVTLVMSGNSCPVFIACVAKLDLYIFGFLYAFRCSK